jgi:hypothetical protein
MTETRGSTSPTPIQTRPRTIVRRTRGSRHGAISRLMSPSDLGQVLKPFVFLDLFDMKGASSGMGLHPHSGIATVSYLFEGSVRYEDSSGATGVLQAGGVEWFKTRSTSRSTQRRYWKDREKEPRYDGYFCHRREHPTGAVF